MGNGVLLRGEYKWEIIMSSDECRYFDGKQCNHGVHHDDCAFDLCPIKKGD